MIVVDRNFGNPLLVVFTLLSLADIIVEDQGATSSSFHVGLWVLDVFNATNTCGSHRVISLTKVLGGADLTSWVIHRNTWKLVGITVATWDNITATFLTGVVQCRGTEIDVVVSLNDLIIVNVL